MIPKREAEIRKSDARANIRAAEEDGASSYLDAMHDRRELLRALDDARAIAGHVFADDHCKFCAAHRHDSEIAWNGGVCRRRVERAEHAEAEQDALRAIVNGLCAYMSDFEDEAKPDELLARVTDLNNRRCDALQQLTYCRLQLRHASEELINRCRVDAPR